MKALSILFMIGLALTASGCSGMFKSAESAGKGVEEFHRLYNDGKFQEIYDAGSASLKAATEEKAFLDLLGAVQRKLGKETKTSTTNANVRTVNTATTVVLVQSTTFENGTATETFTFEMDGDNAVLAGYWINSTDLILK